jgi:hypothetical protein
MSSNHILELVNNLATINRLFLVIYLIKFLVFEKFVPVVRESLIIPDISRHALCLAFAITIDKVGALIVGITIWLWRAMGLGGGSGLVSLSAVPGMVIGSILMTIGTLLLIRILSIAKYGDIIWHSVIMIDFVYLIISF